jgi:hypothetical protein
LKKCRRKKYFDYYLKLLTDDFTTNDVVGFSFVDSGLSSPELFIGNIAIESIYSERFLLNNCGSIWSRSVIKIRLNKKIKFQYNQPSSVFNGCSDWLSASVLEWLVSLSKNNQRIILMWKKLFLYLPRSKNNKSSFQTVVVARERKHNSKKQEF